MTSDKEGSFLLELATPVFGPDRDNKKDGEPRDMSTLQNMVNEVFYDEGYIQDVDPNEAQNVDNNNNQDIDINADLEEVVEPPSKKQKHK
jgi:ribosomal protein S8